MQGEALSLRRRLRRRFYWALVWWLLKLAETIPLSWGRGLCAVLGMTALRVRTRERALAEDNISRALPELSSHEQAVLVRNTARSLGRNLFQTLAAPRLLETPKAIIEENSCGADNLTIGEHLTELAAAGRGVFILTGHIGSWELAGGWVARTMKARGLGALGVVTGTVHNPAVNRMLQSRRQALGLHVLAREDGAAPLVRFLRAGGVVAILQDQQTSVRNLTVPFFGLPAPTPAGMAALALKYDIPVLPVVGVWDEARRVQVMQHLPPIRPADFAADDQLGFLAECNRALEILIRRNPDQWVWFHRRWNPEP